MGYCIDTTAVLDLGKEIKKNVQNDNMLAWQYNTVGVSDGITMGGEGVLRYQSTSPTINCEKACDSRYRLVR